MSLLSWNCCGSGGATTVPTIWRYLQCTGADLALIYETKCSRFQAEKCISKLPLKNAEIVPSNGQGGGLWLMWSDSVSVAILETNIYYIVAEIRLLPNADPWILFGVYGDYGDRVNDIIWNRIQHYAQASGMALCAVGDFNCISDQAEKQGGSTQFKTKNKKFRSFLQRVGLIDLGHTRLAYTWANNQ